MVSHLTLNITLAILVLLQISLRSKSAASIEGGVGVKERSEDCRHVTVG